MEEIKKETAGRAGRLALIMPGKQKDLFSAAVVMLKESLLEKFPNFDTENDCFINFGEDLLELDLGSYHKILVVDPDNKLLGIESFIIKNCHGEAAKRFSWYVGRSEKIPRMKRFFGENSVHIFNEQYLESKPTLDDYALRLLGAVYSLKLGVPDSCPIMKRVSEAVRIAKLKDRENVSGKPVLMEKTMKQLLYELVTKNESSLIVDSVLEFKLLKEAEKRAKRSRVEHPLLGKLKIVKPKRGSMIESKTFFEQGFQLGYDAVAVKSVAQGGYELCVKKINAQKVADGIPIVKRINGCRFIVAKEFLIQAQQK